MSIGAVGTFNEVITKEVIPRAVGVTKVVIEVVINVENC